MRGFLIAASDELLLRVQKIQSMKRPTTRAQTTLFNLIHNTESLVADEADFIRHSADLASLVPGVEHGWFKGFLEDVLNLISRRAAKVYRVFPYVNYDIKRHTRPYMIFQLSCPEVGHWENIIVLKEKDLTKFCRLSSAQANRPSKQAMRNCRSWMGGAWISYSVSY